MCEEEKNLIRKILFQNHNKHCFEVSYKIWLMKILMILSPKEKLSDFFCVFFRPQNFEVNFPDTGGYPSYITNLSDKQASKKIKKWIRRGGTRLTS